MTGGYGRAHEPMREIDDSTAAGYLSDMGWVPKDAEVLVRELSGGVSNIVLRVDVAGKPPFVLKQCRERLRVPMEWQAPLERIWTEYTCLQLLHSLLPQGAGSRNSVRRSPELFVCDDLRTGRVCHMENSLDGRPD